MNPQQLIKEYREEFIKVYFEDVEPIEKDLVNRPENIADWWTVKMSQSLLKFIDQEIERLKDSKKRFRCCACDSKTSNQSHTLFCKFRKEQLTHLESLKEELKK